MSPVRSKLRFDSATKSSTCRDSQEQPSSSIIWDGIKIANQQCSSEGMRSEN
jgi:hypothetical protein